MRRVLASVAQGTSAMRSAGSAGRPTLVWTRVDEAPALASYSLFPIVQAVSSVAGIDVVEKDISVAGRIIAQFSDELPADRRRADHLAELGALALTPEACIIKLPNVSASIPQLKAAIAELRAHGFPVPEYPEDPKDDKERAIKAKYSKVLGSAVNPVLREGNSDRRSAASVKAAARKHPHRLTKWPKDSKTAVRHMESGDFYASEVSHRFAAATELRIEHVDATGKVTVLKEKLPIQAGEIVDASRLSVRELRAFYEREFAACKESGALLSLHLKATMMKISDPIMFGHAVSVYFKDVFAKHGAALERVGANPNNGLGDVLAKLEKLPASERAAIEEDIKAALANGPPLAMVNSDKGITNLHVPSDVIIDASMPPMVRDGGRMYNAAGKLQDTKALVPDRSYAGMYAACVEWHKANGALDPSKIGSVANVGLMAQKAEEYGSHDKTFEIPAAGTVRVVDAKAGGKVVFEHTVERGDIWRACQTKDAPVKDWVKLAVSRARVTGTPAIFWLDSARAHDRVVREQAEKYMQEHDTAGLDIRFLAPPEACRVSLDLIAQGKDVISVTGNVLRDYLTDLFPILELGTSAKMLSIVPLLAGGGLYETGAGGSAPKHVQQFQEEGYLRWDSLGEFLALQAALEDLAHKRSHSGAGVLGAALDAANAKFLEANKSPARAVGGIDNRGSHLWLAHYWLDALAAQSKDAALRARYAPVAAELAANVSSIDKELISFQGKPQDIGGYFQPDDAKAAAAMRPSALFNGIIARLTAP